jgi:hypothetical protein
MATDWLRYANAGATRDQPLDPRLINSLGFLKDLGVTMEVFSGGQAGSGPKRVGSHRHDHGQAADAFFYKDGRKLDWANEADRPLFEDIVRRGKAAGVTGFGAGPGYMQQGSMHLGFGSPAVWGAGGQGENAPSWLRNAYGLVADGPKGQESYPPNVFGSMSPKSFFGGGDNSIDPGVANFAFGDEPKSLGDRLKGAGEGFDAAMSEVKPPRIAPMPGPSGDVANGLAKLMQNPQALAQLLMKQRIA